MAQSELVELLKSKGYNDSANMWALVDEPEELFGELSDEVVEKIGVSSYVITKDMLLEVSEQCANELGVSGQEVEQAIVQGEDSAFISDIVDFYCSCAGCKLKIETSFGENDVFAVAIK